VRVLKELGTAGAELAAARGDVVVLVDALRACVTITAAPAVGARQVIPVLTVERARSYLSQSGFCVAGERHTVKVPGLHFDNLPTELMHHADRLRGQTLVLTTSNGTACVQAVRKGARALLAGSLPNAAAVTQAAFRLAREEGCDVTLVAAGQDGQPAAEDEYSVAMLAGLLVVLGADAAIPLLSVAAEAAFRGSPHGERLVRLGYEEDLALCAETNIFEAVGILQSDGFVLARGTT